MLLRPGSYTELHLFRHAEGGHMADENTISGHAPYAQLTKAGFKQARQLGRGWNDEGIRPDRADASSLTRALQTLNNALMARPQGGMPIGSTKSLREQCMGAHEGQLHSVVYARDSPATRGLQALGADYRHPGHNQAGERGESTNDVIHRMASYVIGLRASLDTPPPEQVVAVGHYSSIRALLAYEALGGLSGTRTVDPLELQAAFREQPKLEPCSDTLIVLEGDPANFRWRVEFAGLALSSEFDNLYL